MENLEYVETAHAVVEIGHGLLSRIYYYKSKLQRPELAPPSLVDPAMGKVQISLLKEYPEYNPRRPPVGVKHFHLFLQNYHTIYDQMEPLKDILEDVIDFRWHADCAIPIMLTSIDAWHLEVNRPLLFLLFEVITLYVRVLSLLATVDDLAIQVAMLDASAKEMEKTHIKYKEISRLMKFIMTPQASLTNNFSEVVTAITPAFTELGRLAEAVSSVHKLTHGGALDVLKECSDLGALSASPIFATTSNVPSGTESDIYPLISMSDKVSEYILLTTVVCPTLLRSKLNFEIFQREARKNTVVELYRDLGLNIHAEFKMMFKNERKKRASDPKIVRDPVRFGKVLKKLAREANTYSCHIRRVRRGGLLAQLKLLNGLIDACPALLAPKLPLVLALGALARSELESFFRHFRRETKDDDLLRVKVSKRGSGRQTLMARKSVFLNDAATEDGSTPETEGDGDVDGDFDEGGDDEPAEDEDVDEPPSDDEDEPDEPPSEDDNDVPPDDEAGSEENEARGDNIESGENHGEKLYTGDSDGTDAPALLTELIALLRHLQAARTKENVTEYFGKLLRGADLNYLIKLLDNAVHDIENVTEAIELSDAGFERPMLDTLLGGMRQLLHRLDSSWSHGSGNGHSAMNISEITDGNGAAAVAKDEWTDMLALRINRDRLAAFLSQRRSWPHMKPAIITLMAHLNSVCERSVFIDRYNSLVEDLIMPRRLWWANRALRECFGRLGRIPSQTHHIPSFMQVCCYAAHNAHPLCPEERLRLGYAARSLATNMMASIKKSTKELLCDLVQMRLKLACEATPLEGSLRRQRRKDCLAEGRPFVETMPGVESEAWAEVRIQGLVAVESALMGIIRACYRMSDMNVQGQRISPASAIDEALHEYLAETVEDILFPDGDLIDPKVDPASVYANHDQAVGANIVVSHSEDGEEGEATTALMERPSVALRRLEVVQITLDQVMAECGRDCSSEVRKLLAEHFATPEVPAVGKSINPSVEAGEGDMWLVAHWFRAVMAKMSKANSGLVWNPSTDEFTRPVSKFSGVRNSFPVELYLNSADLQALCTLIGAPGVRCLDTVLLQVIEFNIRVIKRYLQVHQDVLETLHADEHSFAKQYELEGPLARLVNIGVCLAVRNALYSALKVVQQKTVPNLQSAMEAVVKTVDAWEWRVQANRASLRDMDEEPGVGDDEHDTQSPEARRRVALSTLTHTPLFTVAADTGTVPVDFDLNLSGIMSDVFCTNEDLELLGLIPTAATLALQSSRWERSEYFKDLEAFQGNEHCMMNATAMLLGGTLDGAFAGPIATTGPESRNMATARCRDFLGSSSLTLSYMTSQETLKAYVGFPLRPMLLLLELFVEYCPIVSESELESVLPYAMRQSAREMVHMGVMYGDEVG